MVLRLKGLFKALFSSIKTTFAFSIVLLIHAVIDGGWFVVGILIGGLFSNKLFLALQDSHEYGVLKNRFSRTGTLL